MTWYDSWHVCVKVGTLTLVQQGNTQFFANVCECLAVLPSYLTTDREQFCKKVSWRVNRNVGL